MSGVLFSLRLDADLREAVEEEAKREERSASDVIQRAAREYVVRKENFRAMGAELEAEADKGLFISR